VQEEKFSMFHNRLVKVYRHTGKQARRLNVSCYRLYDHDLPEFPFCIELYDDKIYVAEYRRNHGMSDEAHDAWMEHSLTIISEVLGISKENTFLRLRQRKSGRLGQYQKFDGVLHEFEVMENGLKFIVNLSDYLDTGLFLDHRLTREAVRQQAAGKKMLNLFAYTGSFSVYAAAGEAAQVATVDLSKTYLAWAEKNMKLNGFDDAERYSFIHADVKQYLRTLPAASFDLIVMDPPTFSNSKRMEDFLDIQRDHVELINNCLAALSPDGKLYFSTNFSKFELDATSFTSVTWKDITKLTTPFDFTGKLSRFCFLFTKSIK
jgi:23S rRNA (cytosine1962-C5)-methyltransferase